MSDRTRSASCGHPFCKDCNEVDECCKCGTEIPPRTVAERLAQHEHVEIVEGVLGGVTPLVSRRRISVHHILSYLYNGEDIDYISQNYQLAPEAIKDAIAFAQEVYDDAIAIAVACRAPVAARVDDGLISRDKAVDAIEGERVDAGLSGSVDYEKRMSYNSGLDRALSIIEAFVVPSPTSVVAQDARALVEGCAVNMERSEANGRVFVTAAFDTLIERITTLTNQRYMEGVEAAELKALEQRCERGTPWDAACVAAAKAIRALLNEGEDE